MDDGFLIEVGRRKMDRSCGRGRYRNEMVEEEV